MGRAIPASARRDGQTRRASGVQWAGQHPTRLMEALCPACRLSVTTFQACPMHDENSGIMSQAIATSVLNLLMPSLACDDSGTAEQTPRAHYAELNASWTKRKTDRRGYDAIASINRPLRLFCPKTPMSSHNCRPLVNSCRGLSDHLSENHSPVTSLNRPADVTELSLRKRAPSEQHARRLKMRGVFLASFSFLFFRLFLSLTSAHEKLGWKPDRRPSLRPLAARGRGSKRRIVEIHRGFGSSGHLLHLRYSA